MSAANRRDAIAQAVLPVFATHGCEAATTRDLAAAAAVSEALLYRHFPSKRALYEAALDAADADAAPDAVLARLSALPSSPRRLIGMVHHLVHAALDPADDLRARLLAQSLLDDGGYARTAMDAYRATIGTRLQDAIRAARADGHLDAEASDDLLSAWAVHHLALALQWIALPGEHAPHYGASRSQVAEHCVRFALRGIGLRRAVIQRFYEVDRAWLDTVLT